MFKCPSRRFVIEQETFIYDYSQDEAKSRTVQEALSFLSTIEWNNAMNDKMEPVRTNHAWDLVDLPPRRS